MLYYTVNKQHFSDHSFSLSHLMKHDETISILASRKAAKHSLSHSGITTGMILTGLKMMSDVLCFLKYYDAATLTFFFGVSRCCRN